MVVLRRGGISFIDKLLRVQQHGGAAALILQNTDAWPYQMSDATKNAAADAPSFPFGLMISKGAVCLPVNLIVHTN